MEGIVHHKLSAPMMRVATMGHGAFHIDISQFLTLYALVHTLPLRVVLLLTLTRDSIYLETQPWGYLPLISQQLILADSSPVETQ